MKGHLIANHLQTIWKELKIAEKHAQCVAVHQLKQMILSCSLHGLENALPLDNDTKKIQNQTDGESEDQDESKHGSDMDNGNDENGKENDEHSDGEAEPLVQAVMFNKALQLTDQIGSPHLQICLKCYISSERKVKACCLLSVPNPIVLDGGLDPHGIKYNGLAQQISWQQFSSALNYSSSSPPPTL